MRATGVMFALIAACGPAQRVVGERPRAGDVALVDVNVVDPAAGAVTPHQTIVLRGDTIVAMGPSSAIAIPAGVTRVEEATGKWVLPGLIDMHVHFWREEDLALELANGVTTVRNMLGAPEYVEFRARVASGDLLGPQIFTAGPVVDGDPPIWPGSAVLVDPADAPRIVAEQQRAGYDFIKPYSLLSLEAYDALVAAAKQANMPVMGHVPRAVPLAHALASGQRTIEHLSGYSDALVADGTPPAEVKSFGATAWRLVEHLDERKLALVARATADAHTANCPTLIVLDRIAHIDDYDTLAALPEARYVPPSMLDAWRPENDFRLQAMTAEDFAAMREQSAILSRMVRALADAGAPIIAGTDTNNPFVVAGFALHRELALLEAAGLTRAQALAAATTNAADVLGQRGRLGVVAVGARADLVITGANPLDDLAHARPEVGVIVRGRFLSAAELTAKLDAIAAAAAAPPSRWDGGPALPSEGTRVFSARYEVKWAGRDASSERVAVDRRADGTLVLVGQQVIDAPVNARLAWRQTATTIELVEELGGGKTTKVRTERRAGKVDLTGTSASGDDVRAQIDLAETGIVAPQSIGEFFALGEALAPLAVGKTVTIAAAEILTTPSVALEPAEYEVRRLDDAQATVAGQSIAVRAYTFQGTVSGKAFKGAMSVDADGRPVLVTVTLGRLEIVFARVE